MRVFASEELSRMQMTQESAMMDQCTLLRRTTTGTDDYGQPVEAFVDFAVAECGFDSRASREVMGASQVPVYDARLRLAMEYESLVSNVDRVRITHRFSEALETALTYDVDGLAVRGPSGLLLNLRKVTDGS